MPKYTTCLRCKVTSETGAKEGHGYVSMCRHCIGQRGYLAPEMVVGDNFWKQEAQAAKNWPEGLAVDAHFVDDDQTPKLLSIKGISEMKEVWKATEGLKVEDLGFAGPFLSENHPLRAEFEAQEERLFRDYFDVVAFNTKEERAVTLPPEVQAEIDREEAPDDVGDEVRAEEEAEEARVNAEFDRMERMEQEEAEDEKPSEWPRRTGGVRL